MEKAKSVLGRIRLNKSNWIPTERLGLLRDRLQRIVENTPFVRVYAKMFQQSPIFCFSQADHSVPSEIKLI